MCCRWIIKTGFEEIHTWCEMRLHPSPRLDSHRQREDGQKKQYTQKHSVWQKHEQSQVLIQAQTKLKLLVVVALM